MSDELSFLNKINSNNLCLFVGSAISTKSGLPQADDLGKEVLIQLSKADPDKEADQWSKQEADRLCKEYHLERMLFLMKSYLGNYIEECYEAVNTDNYTLNHEILSSLIYYYGIPVLTTNQDNLIEYSYKTLFSQEVPSQLVKKIHGSVNDMSSLRATLDKVSGLPPNEINDYESITKNRYIVAIGYSFSDYDLKSFFENEDIKRNLYAIVRRKKTTEKKEASKPVSFFKTYLWNDDPYECEKRLIECDADDFLKKLANKFSIKTEEEGKYTKYSNHDWKETVSNWARSCSDYRKKMAVACLYQANWKGQHTKEVMKKIGEELSIPLQYRALAFAEASRAAEGLSHYKQQRYFINKLRSLKGEYQNKSFISFLYNLKHAAYHHIQDNPINCLKGLYHYYKSKKILLHKLDSHISPFRENPFLYQQYIKETNHGISSTIDKLNQYPILNLAASRCNNHALVLINQYIDSSKSRHGEPCDLDFLCEALFVSGKLNIQKKEYKNAKNKYHKALEIADWISKIHSQEQGNKKLARLYLHLAVQNRNNETCYEYIANSLKHAYQSRNLVRKMNEPILKAKSYLTIAKIASFIRKDNELNKRKIDEYIDKQIGHYPDKIKKCRQIEKNGQNYKKKAIEIYIRYRSNCGYIEPYLYLWFVK